MKSGTETGALDEFGKATHALADFYAHTNWLEIAVEAGQPPGLAPLTGSECSPSGFPSELQSGYADVGAYLLHGSLGENAWCPDRTPPPGFRWCHDGLNKDEPDTPEGRIPLTDDVLARIRADQRWRDFTGTNYHEVAVALATRATKDMWEGLHARIITRYESDKTIDAECIFMKLAWGGDRPCHRLWRVRGSQTVHARFRESADPTDFFVRDHDHVIEATGLDFLLRWEPTPYSGSAGPSRSSAVETTSTNAQSRQIEMATTSPRTGSGGTSVLRCEGRGEHAATSGGRSAMLVQPETALLNLQSETGGGAGGLYSFDARQVRLSGSCTLTTPSGVSRSEYSPSRNARNLSQYARTSYADMERNCAGASRLALRAGTQTFGPCHWGELPEFDLEQRFEFTLEPISEDW